jgi:hypothetical protein
VLLRVARLALDVNATAIVAFAVLTKRSLHESVVGRSSSSAVAFAPTESTSSQTPPKRQC